MLYNAVAAVMLLAAAPAFADSAVDDAGQTVTVTKSQDANCPAKSAHSQTGSCDVDGTFIDGTSNQNGPTSGSSGQ
jgi:hypothetical protein